MIDNTTYTGSFSFTLDLTDEDDVETAHHLQGLLTGEKVTLNGKPAVLR